MGITNVAVLEKSYIGSGGSGRNTAIVRSNYLTPEGVAFYNRSVFLFERLSADLNFNVMFEQRGHMTLAHSDASLRTMRWRAEVNKVQGIDSEVIDPDEIKKLVPFMDVSTKARQPIRGALWHPPGGIARHDAVVWSYARARRCGRRSDPHEHRSDRNRRTGGQSRRRGDFPRQDLDTYRRQLHRWLVLHHLGHGRGQDADPYPAVAGGGDGAGEVLPRPGRGFWFVTCVRKPDRPRRARLRRRHGSLRVILDPQARSTSSRAWPGMSSS